MEILTTVFFITTVVLVLFMVVTNDWFRFRAHKIEEMSALDTSPGWRVVDYKNKLWEATHIQYHSNPHKFTLRLQRGGEEPLIEEFDIAQFTNVHSLISIFFPDTATVLRVARAGDMDELVGGDGKDKGEKRYPLNWAMMTHRNAELDSELRNTKMQLLNLQENFEDRLEDRWGEIMRVQMSGGKPTPQTGKKGE